MITPCGNNSTSVALWHLYRSNRYRITLERHTFNSRIRGLKPSRSCTPHTQLDLTVNLKTYHGLLNNLIRDVRRGLVPSWESLYVPYLSSSLYPVEEERKFHLYIKQEIDCRKSYYNFSSFLESKEYCREGEIRFEEVKYWAIHEDANACAGFYSPLLVQNHDFEQYSSPQFLSQSILVMHSNV